MSAIAICGTHSSGKTTLAKALAEALGLPYLAADPSRELVRSFGARDFDAFASFPLEIRWAFQEAMLETLSAAMEQDGVADGTPLSCLPYGHALLGDEAFASPRGLDLQARARAAATKSRALFLLPPEIGLELDGSRHVDPAFRATVAAELSREVAGLPHTVLTGTVADRVQTACAVLGQGRPPRGHHIVLEGLCNSGKTTVMRALRQALAERGLRPALVERTALPDGLAETDRLEALYAEPEAHAHEIIAGLVAAYEHHHRTGQVGERLAAGEPLLADRQKFSVIALGLALGLPEGELYAMTAGLPTPGTVILLDADPDACAGRADASKPLLVMRGNRDLQRRIATAYRALATRHPEIVVVPTANLFDILPAVLEIALRSLTSAPSETRPAMS